MARFVITDPIQRRQIFEIVGPQLDIGRSGLNQLVLDHPSVSRHHARLAILPGDKAVLTDLDSLNGLLVNGEPVQEARLRDQDVATIGMFELRFEVPAEPLLEVEAGARMPAQVAGLLSPEGAPPGSPRGLLFESIAGASTPSAVEPGASRDQRLLELEDENRLLRVLAGVGKALATVLTPDEIMRRVMELVFQIQNVERGFVMLKDENGLRPALVLYRDEHLASDMPRAADPGNVVLSRKLIERVTSERLPLLIRSVADDPNFRDSESLRISGVRSAMCAPLVSEDRFFGIFYVDCLSKPLAFGQKELSIFSLIAAEAALSFDNARSHEELSRHDLERKALERFLNSSVVEKILENPGRIQLGGESQTAAVLFSDIRGFTHMAETLAPQAVVEQLNEYFTEMTELIFENGGTLDKYLGDGLMAVFGAPIPHPDDSLRAVKTAVDMKLELQRLNRGWEARGLPPFHIGIGIATGQVTAGNVGSLRRMDYTVIGDTVNVASRLCSTAEPGQILISESTFKETVDRFPTLKLNPARVEGRQGEVAVYHVLWNVE